MSVSGVDEEGLTAEQRSRIGDAEDRFDPRDLDTDKETRVSRSRTAYVLSSGEYSDYRVHCVSPSKKAAELLAARLNGPGERYGDRYEVEELPVCDASTERLAVLRKTVTLWDDGREGDEAERVDLEWPWDSRFHAPGGLGPVSWRWVRAPMYRGKGGRLNVEGTDHERVRKVFGDRRAALKTDDALRSQQELTGGVS